MKHLLLVTTFLSLGFMKPGFAYITYQNSRIDRALYDGHDPKLVVIGQITGQKPLEKSPADPAIELGGPPGPISIDFKVAHTLMGNTSFDGTTLELPTLSFDWPSELVKLEIGQKCILIIRIYAYEKTEYHIEVVVPYNENQFTSLPKEAQTVSDNNGARKFLEQQLLAELKTEKDVKRQQALLQQIGPITSSQSEKEILVFTESVNEWVIRAALSALVFSTQKEEYIKVLARDVNGFFTKYSKEDEMIGGNLEYYNYSASYLYYHFVFFLDPGQRHEGSRWDDTEAKINETLVAKLKNTGLLSKKVEHKLKC